MNQVNLQQRKDDDDFIRGIGQIFPVLRSTNLALISASLNFGLNASIGNLNCIAVKLFASRAKGKSSSDLLNFVDIHDLPNCDCVLLQSAKIAPCSLFHRKTETWGMELYAENQISYLQGRTDSHRSYLGA